MTTPRRARIVTRTAAAGTASATDLRTRKTVAMSDAVQKRTSKSMLDSLKVVTQAWGPGDGRTPSTTDVAARTTSWARRRSVP